MPSSRFFTYFQIFKYGIYSLLMLNVFIFFSDEMTAAGHLFMGGVAPGDLFQAFSATIDTASWVVLLLLFEMETYVLSDQQVQQYKWRLHGVRFLSYFFILLSFNGYWDKAFELYEVQAVEASSACQLVDNQTVYLLTLDEFEDLTVDNCMELPTEGGFVQLTGTDIVADAEGDLACLHEDGVGLGVAMLLAEDVAEAIERLGAPQTGDVIAGLYGDLGETGGPGVVAGRRNRDLPTRLHGATGLLVRGPIAVPQECAGDWLFGYPRTVPDVPRESVTWRQRPTDMGASRNARSR